ncbi:MAG: Uncharacterized protein Greene041679_519 [Parcubacteria group bacterium Greene0416_79]|nr:MAG: Uncharacterized protein Greene041679_519 [Parcubacteria group bacterium Greene0416_79]
MEWSAYDRTQKTHAPDWYWAVGIIALSIAITAVILNNLLFAALVVISAVSLCVRTLQKPRLIYYALTSRGVRTGKEFDSYQTLESFRVVEVEEALGEPKLLLKAKGLLSPIRIIPLGGAGADAVREFLVQYLQEEELEEPLARKIMEFLGF